MFKIEVGEVEDVVILKLIGRLNAEPGCERPCEVINAKLAEGRRKFLINFTQLQHVSSAGIRLLLLAWKEIDQVSGHMKLCGFQERVRYPMSTSRPPTVFDIHESCEDALNELLSSDYYDEK